jgi:phosphoenolpyruvate carboxylase
VEDAAVRERVMGMIAVEYARTRRMLEVIFDGPLPERRPRIHRMLAVREEGLRVLHRQQLALLREWRALRREDDPSAGERVLPQLLLTVNAIAGGLRTTG